MGAQLACEAVYRDAMKWFKFNIDKDTYVSSFQALDRDKDGGVDIQEFQGWISDNARKFPDSSWSLFERMGVVLMCAHKAGACHLDNAERMVKQRKVYDISDFRAVLLHLYAFSIFWRHYNASDNKPSRIMIKKKMDELEFAQACQSLASAHGCSFIGVDQLKEDFGEVDTNYSGSVGFIQICTAACKFINTPPEVDAPVLPKIELSVAKKKNMAKAMKLLGVQLDESSTHVTADFNGNKPSKVMALTGMSPEDKANLAFDRIRDKLNREDLFIKNYQSNRWQEFKTTFENGVVSEQFGDHEIAGIHAEAEAMKAQNAASDITAFTTPSTTFGLV